jgi:hypothetical protein
MEDLEEKIFSGSCLQSYNKPSTFKPVAYSLCPLTYESQQEVTILYVAEKPNKFCSKRSDTFRASVFISFSNIEQV